VKRYIAISVLVLGAFSLGLALYYSTEQRTAERLVRKSQELAPAITASMKAFHQERTTANSEKFRSRALQMRDIISQRAYPPDLRASMEYQLKEAVLLVMAMSSDLDPNVKSAIHTRLQPVLSKPN
jgi:uncharacterized protein HemX